MIHILLSCLYYTAGPRPLETSNCTHLLYWVRTSNNNSNTLTRVQYFSAHHISYITANYDCTSNSRWTLSAWSRFGSCSANKTAECSLLNYPSFIWDPLENIIIKPWTRSTKALFDVVCVFFLFFTIDCPWHLKTEYQFSLSYVGVSIKEQKKLIVLYNILLQMYWHPIPNIFQLIKPTVERKRQNPPTRILELPTAKYFYNYTRDLKDWLVTGITCCKGRHTNSQHRFTQICRSVIEQLKDAFVQRGLNIKSLCLEITELSHEFCVSHWGFGLPATDLQLNKQRDTREIKVKPG